MYILRVLIDAQRLGVKSAAKKPVIRTDLTKRHMTIQEEKFNMSCQPWIGRQGPCNLDENGSIGCAIAGSRVVCDAKVKTIDMRGHNQTRSDHRKPARVGDQTAKLHLVTRLSLFT